MPRGVMKPSPIACFGSPPFETLTWTIVPESPISEADLRACRVLPGRPGGLPHVLHVVIQRELVRVRPQPHRFSLVLSLVVDVRLDQLLREDVAAHQESMV